ncbi:MAG: CRISPR-associated helicase Cas3', partial [Candidatus Lokiarchaeota archaeon]|nr:CRISPR-associated helicase Cas3' [Candidatus Lokiarchaeota archaeon]
DVISVESEDYNQFNFVKNNATKIIEINENELKIEDIIKHHKQKSIVICNTVDRCVSLFKSALRYRDKGEITSELICIHSRFFQSDRKAKEEMIINLFSDKYNSDAILFSTQVIEVGLDISCNVMHTEISPINSFLQRIGRCARWGGLGKIFVYEIPGKKNKYLPYDEDLCKLTFSSLSSMNENSIDYFNSQQLIQDVLGNYEKKIFEEILNLSPIRKSEIENCWRSGGKENARNLIRNIQSVNVVLLPKDFSTESLYQYNSISLNPYSLISKIRKRIENIEVDIPEYTLKLEESTFIEFGEDYNEYKKLTVIDFENIAYENIIALNSNLVGYSHEYGLDFDNHFGYRSRTLTLKDKFQYTIFKDTYDQHITWMLEIFNEQFFNQILFVAKKVQEKKYGNVNIIDLIKFIIIMHDYGKLDLTWQKIVNEYQKQKIEAGNNYRPEYLTHTDFDPNSENDKLIMKSTFSKLNKNRKPPHAGIGAFVGAYLLPKLLSLENNSENQSLIKIILTTIMRHHAAFTTNCPAYKISPTAVEMVNRIMASHIPNFTFDYVESTPVSKSGCHELSTSLIQFNNSLENFLYFIFVRILRLCDQLSFEKNPMYLKEVANG